MLIKCPECEKEISDKAKICVNCGYPIADLMVSGTVKVVIPKKMRDSWSGSFSSNKAAVYDSSGEVLWEGKHGETAMFSVEGTIGIVIDLGGWTNRVSGIVKKGKCYSLIKIKDIYEDETYVLVECE